MGLARWMGSTAWVFIIGVAAQAQTGLPQMTVVSATEVEVRSLPSTTSYPTGKLHRGDRVEVVEKKEGGWLAIKPPQGSFSWINTRFIQLSPTEPTAIVLGDDVPAVLGSSLTNDPPTVQQAKLPRGSQVVILSSKKESDSNGVWVMITPPPKEVRYFPANSVQESVPIQSVSSAPPPIPGGVPPEPANRSVPQMNAQVVPDPLWVRADQAELAGNFGEAVQLLDQLGRQTTDHDLSMRALNRSNQLRQRIQGALAQQPPANSMANNSSFPRANTSVPAPTYANGPNNQGWVPPGTSQYTYQRDPMNPQGSNPPMSGNSSSLPRLGPLADWSSPGWLRRTAFKVDAKPTYVLESSQGLPRMYVTALPGVDLESYVGRPVNLFGTITYRGEVKTNYMTVQQVNLLQ